MIGAVTTGFFNSHANAVSAGCSPLALQNFSHASSLLLSFFFPFVARSGAAALFDLLECTARQSAESGLHGMNPSPIVFAGRDDLEFDHAVIQIVETLFADKSHEVTGLGGFLRFGNMPARKVRRANVEHLALSHEASSIACQISSHGVLRST